MYLSRHLRLTKGQAIGVLVLFVLSLFCQATSVLAYEGKPLLLPPLKAKLDLTSPQPTQPLSNNNNKVESVKKVVNSSEKLAIEYLRHGAKLHNNGHSLIAESFFNKAVKLDPANPDAYFNLGALYEAKGDFLKAKGHYQKGLLVSPNDVELLDAVKFVDTRLANLSNYDVVSGLQTDYPVLNAKQPTGRTGTIPFNLKSSMQNIGASSNRQSIAPPVVTVGQTMPVVRKSFMSPKTKSVLGALFRAGISIGIRAAIGGGGCNGGFRF